jgi:hypothetical protein
MQREASQDGEGLGGMADAHAALLLREGYVREGYVEQPM